MDGTDRWMDGWMDGETDESKDEQLGEDRGWRQAMAGAVVATEYPQNTTKLPYSQLRARLEPARCLWKEFL